MSKLLRKKSFLNIFNNPTKFPILNWKNSDAIMKVIYMLMNVACK